MRTTRWTTVAPVVLFALLIAAASACGADESRVTVRSGQIVLGNDTDEFNFSVELPDGWAAGEVFSWQPEFGASGWIVRNADSEVSRVHMTWSSTDGWNSGLLAIVRQSGHIVEERMVDGAVLRLVYPEPLEGGGAIRAVGAVFDDLPGAPDDATRLPLTLQSLNFEDADVPAMIKLFESVRYAEVAPPAEPPVLPGTPEQDWVRLQPADFESHNDRLSPGFSLTVPPGTTGRVSSGYDTVIFEVTLDGLRILGERGQTDLIMKLADPEPGTMIWRGEVGDRDAYFSQADRDDGSFDMRVFIPHLPEGAETSRRLPFNAATFIAEGVPADKREELLTVVSSVVVVN